MSSYREGSLGRPRLVYERKVSLSRSHLFPRQLTARQRFMALIITLIGLASFTVPTVSTSPAVLHRSVWSPLQIVHQIQTGALPAAVLAPSGLGPAELLSRYGYLIFYGFLVGYLVLLVALVGIAVLPSAKMITWVSVFGLAVTLADALFHYPSYQNAIYGEPASGSIHAGMQTLILMIVLALLLAIASPHDAD